MLIIPFRQFPSFTEEITLEGSSYQFAFKWNDRGGYWTMTIADSNLDIVVAGIRLALNYPTTTDINRDNLPPGEIYPIDTTGTKSEIAQEDIGESVEIVYFTEAEADTLRGGGTLAAI